jgi:hypothetical protein
MSASTFDGDAKVSSVLPNDRVSELILLALHAVLERLRWGAQGQLSSPETRLLPASSFFLRLVPLWIAPNLPIMSGQGQLSSPETQSPLCRLYRASTGVPLCSCVRGWVPTS